MWQFLCFAWAVVVQLLYPLLFLSGMGSAAWVAFREGQRCGKERFRRMLGRRKANGKVRMELATGVYVEERAA